MSEKEPERWEWRPIETAPKDGTEILVWLSWGDYEITLWENDRWTWEDRLSSQPEPTHWMPLPPPPDAST